MDDSLFHNMEYDLFLRCMKEGKTTIDETEILFLDDLERGDCIMGYLPSIIFEGKPLHFDAPFWIGDGCDVQDGMEFYSAEEMLHAPVYGGRSIAQAWDQVCVLNLGMMPLDLWFQSCRFRDEVVEEKGVWKLRKKEDRPGEEREEK
ncbi:MAG: hypothetical protein IJD39_06270 [Clostridia bacterium]|nr:hypothetical protein [Clostridia bacterium]